MFDDLLGDSTPTKPVTKGPTGPLNPRAKLPGAKNLKPETDAERRTLNLDVQKVHNVTSGVSLTWLCKVFRLTRYKVEESLRDCPVLRTTTNGGKIYDVAIAAQYLVEPTTNLDAFLQTIKAEKLPEKLRETYWNAKLKEAKYRVIAGELWPTDSVFEVLADTFKTIKKTTQLWIDTIDEEHPLNKEQRATLVLLVDQLQDDIHKALITQARSQETESLLAEIDGETR